jgi:hypothetical protein
MTKTYICALCKESGTFDESMVEGDMAEITETELDQICSGTHPTMSMLCDDCMLFLTMEPQTGSMQ